MPHFYGTKLYIMMKFYLLMILLADGIETLGLFKRQFNPSQFSNRNDFNVYFDYDVTILTMISCVKI